MRIIAVVFMSKNL